MGTMATSPLMPLREPAQPSSPRRPPPPRWHLLHPAAPLWALGFRPFYLLAALLALLTVPLWALQVTGLLTAPLGVAWHAHEMVLGYTLAVVIGFLFTAGRAWSGQPTPSGGALMLLVALWLAGRVLLLTPWGAAAMLANVALPWLAAWGLWRALRAGGNTRNYFFVALLALIGLAALGVHGQTLGWWALPATLGLPLVLDVVLFLLAVIGGRVIPMFSNNGVPGMNAQRHPWVERLALGSVLALLALHLVEPLAPPPWLLGTQALVLATALAAHAVRLTLWQPWRTRRVPLVWVLHLAYAWLVVHLALRLAALFVPTLADAATHALTVGAIGGMTLGMVTRTALGHTGRALRAGAVETAAYACMALAALTRVAAPLVGPGAYQAAVLASAALWAAAFALYLWRYTPWLTAARVDGRPG